MKSTTDRHSNQLQLPACPEGMSGKVKAWREAVKILTYLPECPEPNPMFLEKRVYQGSSGKVYPLVFYSRISQTPVIREWAAIHLENEYIRLMILPELGGRIHIGYDKISGHDFFYRQNVIKPALVGLAGPWISGGVEFNWPQHHRPATFLPVNTAIEHHANGAVTVWCSDNDPILRMKGMHGVRLDPGRAAVDVDVRLFNRTQHTQTFLWWANMAVGVHEKYQAFFPHDVCSVADHAKRAITSFPQSSGRYYGIDYARRAMEGVPVEDKPDTFQPDGAYPPNDLSWYANIPVPTSYMAVGSSQDFFGGYDHRAACGVVHVANHHVAPGKKQWTWGNHEFGYAWERNLTDADGPYIELMAGVYTDNQPDFSYLAPWETKSFRQSWYPIRGIGIPDSANADAALSIRLEGPRVIVSLAATRNMQSISVQLFHGAEKLAGWNVDLSVEQLTQLTHEGEIGLAIDNLSVAIYEKGRLLLKYATTLASGAAATEVAKEPLAPPDIETVEELFLTGVHLMQYRHATRAPELYWHEALRRDPGNSRVQNAMGVWHLRRGEFAEAVACFRYAIKRLTNLNPNPADGESFYHLGIAERFLGHTQQAYDAFFKATWNAACRGPAYFALAEIDAAADRPQEALDHVQRSLRAESDNLNALNLLAFLLDKAGDCDRAQEIREGALALDPLDAGALWVTGQAPVEPQEALDLAFDLIRSGRLVEADSLLQQTSVHTSSGAAVIVLLLRASVQERLNGAGAETTYRRALETSAAFCFPSRLEELVLLQEMLVKHPADPLPMYLAGNLLYDYRRHAEAIALWERAAASQFESATLWRNLGIAYFNVSANAGRAREAYDQAIRLDASDSRIVYERDQLWKRMGISPQQRLSELLRFPGAIASRDDLAVELIGLYNHLDRPNDALRILSGRQFQPWEGGEGLVMSEYVRCRLLLGRKLLQAAQPAEALLHLQCALRPPETLGEARHLLANQSDIWFWMGVAYDTMGDPLQAEQCWRRSAAYRGDFKEMSVRSVSEMAYWSALSLQRLGEAVEANALLQEIFDYSIELEAREAVIDYFATSLPTMLVFNDDLQARQLNEAHLLRSQALFGLNRRDEARVLLEGVLRRDPSHSGASDLLTHPVQGGYV